MIEEILTIAYDAGAETPLEDVCVDRGLEEAFDAEVPKVQEAIVTLNQQIDRLQADVWGEGTPEGRELDRTQGILNAQSAELGALQDAIDSAQTLEEYERAVLNAQERMEEIKAQVLRSAERVSQLSGA